MPRGGKSADQERTRRLCRKILGSPYEAVLGSGERGVDLNMVVRQLLAKRMLDEDLSQVAASARFGLRQRSLGRFLNGQGLHLSTLSELIAKLESRPLHFLSDHRAFGGKLPDGPEPERAKTKKP